MKTSTFKPAVVSMARAPGCESAGLAAMQLLASGAMCSITGMLHAAAAFLEDLHQESLVMEPTTASACFVSDNSGAVLCLQI